MTDVLRARHTLGRHLAPTPSNHYPALDRTTGATVLVKHENVNPTGAFKVRGGLTLLSGMPAEERARGVVGYSTGNHAQSLAYAARTFSAGCTIVMPEGANPTKAQAVRDLGADLVEHGALFEECRARAEQIAVEKRMRLASAANEPAIVAGVATAYVELIEQAPDLDAIIVPVGSGSGAAAACLVANALAPSCRIVAVQSSASPAAHDSWRKGELLERPNRTRAEGLATGCAFELTQRILREHLDDFVLVGDDAIQQAQWTMLTDAHTLAEGAGAAALAAVLQDPTSYAGKRVGIMCSGGNASPSEIRTVAGGAA
ncbi:MAG: threonine ammonia-lyase [Nocardioidaceae bacterium]